MQCPDSLWFRVSPDVSILTRPGGRMQRLCTIVVERNLSTTVALRKGGIVPGIFLGIVPGTSATSCVARFDVPC